MPTAFRSGGDSPYDSDSMGSQSSMGGSDTGGNSDEEAEDMDVSTDRNSSVRMAPPRSVARGIALGRSEAACSEARPPAHPAPTL